MITVTVHVTSADSDTWEQDLLTRQLRRELLALDVDDVRLARDGAAPPGAKGDPVTVGTLVLTLTPVVLASVCQVARTWITRHQGRRLTLRNGERTLEITGANDEQHQQLIAAFLAEDPADPPALESPR